MVNLATYELYAGVYTHKIIIREAYAPPLTRSTSLLASSPLDMQICAASSLPFFYLTGGNLTENFAHPWYIKKIPYCPYICARSCIALQTGPRNTIHNFARTEIPGFRAEARSTIKIP